MSLTTRQERWLLLALAAVQFTHIMDFMILMPLGPQLMRLFDIGPQQFGLLVSAYTFSAGICGFLSAFFVDRFDRKQVLTFLYSGFLVGTLACALAPSYPFLLAARILTGAFGGILAAVVLAVVSDVIPMQRRATAMGIVTSAFSAASVFGIPFGLFLASQFSWHAPFLFLVGTGVIVLALITRLVPKMRGHIKPQGQAYGPLSILKNAVSQPGQRDALLLTVLMITGQFAIIPFLSPSMVANVGFSEAQLTYIYLLGGATTLITGPMIGKLADRLGKVRVMTVFMLLSMIPQLLMTHLGPTPIGLVLLLTTSFFIVSGGRMIPSMALISGTVRPEHRGSFMSIQSSVQQIASGVASLVAGMIVVQDAQGHLLHFERIGYLAVVTTLICIPIGWRMARRSVEKASDAPPAVVAEPLPQH
ncbi:MAG: MFS transporter [Candidatus Sericytochromatia bacterium]